MGVVVVVVDGVVEPASMDDALSGGGVYKSALPSKSVAYVPCSVMWRVDVRIRKRCWISILV